MSDLFISTSSAFYLCEDEFDDITDYVDEFKEVIKQREFLRIPFGHNSPQMEYRKNLVDFLKRICTVKNLSLSCLHLAVYILDVFMDNHNIIPQQLYLVANVCLLIAAKFEENSLTTPKIAELNSLVDNKYDPNNYKKMEMLILKYFDYFIMFPTVTHYTYYFMSYCFTAENLKDKASLYDVQIAIRAYLDKILDDVHFTQNKPSQLAAAAIAASRMDVGLTCWTKELVDLTDYVEEDLKELIGMFTKETTLDCHKCERCNTLKM